MAVMSGAAVFSLVLIGSWCAVALQYSQYSSSALIQNNLASSVGAMPNVRPAPEDRKFRSQVIDSVIANITGRMLDADLATLFSNCWPNTLDTTVQFFNASAPDAFIITGDISAQWLRDSTNQILPYLPFAASDPSINALACGLLRRQARDVTWDPYANSFNFAQEV